MKRRLLLGSMAIAALPSMASALQPKTLLTDAGRIGRVNNAATNTYDFSEADFLKLGTTRITTSTPWTPTSVFVGPLLIDAMQAAGVTSVTLTFKTLDDYSEIESFSETAGVGGRAEGFGDFTDTSMCQAANASDRQ